MSLNSSLKRRKTNHQVNISSNIETNDIFDELSNENKRLLNELLFANKCLKSLINFQTFVDFISHKFKNYLNSNECQKFEKLRKDIEDVKQMTKLNEFTESVENNCFQLIVINNKEVVKCESCLQVFISSDDYKRHLKVHTNSTVKPFVCYIPCSRSFSSLQDLKYHSNECHSHHSNPLNAIKVNIDSNPVKSKLNELNEWIKTNAPKISDKISKNISNDNQINDNSDHDSDDDRLVIQTNDSNDYIPHKTTPDVSEDELETNDSPDSTQFDYNSTQTDLEFKRKDRLIECPVNGCYETFFGSLPRLHLLGFHKNSQLICSVDGCNQSFKSIHPFIKHLRTHPSYADQLKTFPKVVTLPHKTEEREGQTYYICTIDNCGKTFDKYRNVYEHKRRHQRNQTLNDLLEYKNTIHGRDGIHSKEELSSKLNSTILEQAQTKRKRDVQPFFTTGRKDGHIFCYICIFKDCVKRFATYSGVYTHYNKYHNQKQVRNLQTEECNDRSDTPLKQQKEWNSNPKDLKVIPKDKPIKCPISGCNKTFVGKFSKIHLRVVHKEYELNCSVDGCNQTFESYIKFIKHLWTHPLYADQFKRFDPKRLWSKSGPKRSRVQPFYKTEEREGQTMFICTIDYCGKSFDKYRNVYEHKRRHQRNQMLLKQKKTIDRKDDIHSEEDLSSNSDVCEQTKVEKREVLEPFFKNETKDDNIYYICISKDCSKRFASYGGVYKHYRKHHNQKNLRSADIRARKLKRFVCNHNDCGVVLIGINAYNKHINTHKDYRFKCKWIGCDFQCKARNYMKEHMERHNNNELFVCKICNKEYSTQKSLKQHMDQLHDKSGHKFICDFKGCGKTFKCENYLRIHRKGHRPHPRIENSEKLFKCDYKGCSKAFANNHGLKFHMLTHREPSVKCVWPGCEYKARHVYAMRRHEWIHKPDVPRFVCEWPECGKTIQCQNNFRYHMRAHLNDKRYVCEWPGCEFRSISHQSIAKHRKTHRT